MTLIHVSKMTNMQLDWAVAKCEGCNMEAGALHYPYSASWEYAGPIIERENISIVRCDDDYEEDSQGYCTNKRIPVWAAVDGQHRIDDYVYIEDNNAVYGGTPLIAAMRFFVTKKLGYKVEIPEELS